jgi:hypothetical protein
MSWAKSKQHDAAAKRLEAQQRMDLEMQFILLCAAAAEAWQRISMGSHSVRFRNAWFVRRKQAASQGTVPIDNFDGEYAFLANTYAASVYYEGVPCDHSRPSERPCTTCRMHWLCR